MEPNKDENRVISGAMLLPDLCEALGIKPNRIQRIVIDCSWDNVVTVYVQKVGTQALLDFDWRAFLQGDKVTVVQMETTT